MAFAIFDLRGEGAMAVNILEVIRVFEKFGVGERMKYEAPIPPFLAVLGLSLSSMRNRRIDRARLRAMGP